MSKVCDAEVDKKNNKQAITTCCSLAAGLRGNEERMKKCRGNGEEVERKWRENEEKEVEGKWS